MLATFKLRNGCNDIPSLIIFITRGRIIIFLFIIYVFHNREKVFLHESTKKKVLF
jgi:hypothetical protein